MIVSIRTMNLSEVDHVMDYFHDASAEYLEILGVDPTRLPSLLQWRKLFEADFALPVGQRRNFYLLWERDGKPAGFSSADKIKFGQEAYMHLHVFDPLNRATGLGAEAVRKSVDLYFDALKLQKLFCEPNAFNVAPNRALQKAGFRYVKTHNTVPGPLNFHQAVTQWVFDRAKKNDA